MTVNIGCYDSATVTNVNIPVILFFTGRQLSNGPEVHSRLYNTLTYTWASVGIVSDKSVENPEHIAINIDIKPSVKIYKLLASSVWCNDASCHTTINSTVLKHSRDHVVQHLHLRDN